MTLKGFPELAAKLKNLEPAAKKGAEAGLFALGNNIMTEAKQRVPVDQGILRASGYVSPPEDGNVELGFGGAASAYAVKQHEDLTLRHPGGGQAKFLESAIDDARSSAAEVVAGFARKAVGG